MVSKEGGAPTAVTLEELSRHAGPGWRNLVQEEVAEFKELLEDIDDSPAKRQVVSHLDRTRFLAVE